MHLHTIDWAPLSAKIHKEKRALHKNKYSLPTTTSLQLWLMFGVIIMITGIILFFSVEKLRDGLLAGGSLVIMGSLPVWVYLQRRREAWAASVRFQKFAQANGFAYEKKSTHNPSRIEARFASSTLIDWRVVSGNYAGRVFSFGTHSEELKGSDNVSMQRLGFFRVQLSKPQPRTVLVRKTKINKRPQNLKRLPEIGGDFYSKFKLYGTPESRQALEKILTPELQASILAIRPALDIELKDSSIYFYYRTEFPASRNKIEQFFNLTLLLP